MKNELKRAEMKILTVFFMIFVLCSSGAYGIEDMISSSGPGMTLLLLIILPFFWSIPLGLISAELGSAIPEEGGFYKWVQRGLGEFWGFQSGWWYTLSILVDSAVYVVLAVGYFSNFIEILPLMQWLVSLGLILIFTFINIKGIEVVGITSTIFSVAILIPFLISTIVGFVHWQWNPVVPFIPEGETAFGSIGVGLAIGMWMYSGYEAMSTMAGEIRNPQKIIPKALLVAIPFIIAVYILPTISGIAAVGDWESWSTEGGIDFVSVGAQLLGPAFGVIFLITAILSNIALYNGYLASGSRIPFAMAEDNLLPKFIGRIHPKFGTPVAAILIMAIVNVVLCIGTFENLVVIDVFMLMFAYILIFISAIVLRIKEPDMERPYKVPLKTGGLIAICVAPILIAVIALFTNGIEYIIGGVIGALTGPLAYWIFKKKYGGVPKAEVLG